MKRGDPTRFAHPGFQDMTGKRIGRLTVISRAATTNGNARWHCDCECGERCIVEGIRLRAVLKRPSVESYSCPACRPKRPKEGHG